MVLPSRRFLLLLLAALFFGLFLLDLLLLLERDLQNANLGHSHDLRFIAPFVERLQSRDPLCTRQNIASLDRPCLNLQALVHCHFEGSPPEKFADSLFKNGETRQIPLLVQSFLELSNNLQAVCELRRLLGISVFGNGIATFFRNFASTTPAVGFHYRPFAAMLTILNRVYWRGLLAG